MRRNSSTQDDGTCTSLKLKAPQISKQQSIHEIVVISDENKKNPAETSSENHQYSKSIQQQLRQRHCIRQKNGNIKVKKSKKQLKHDLSKSLDYIHPENFSYFDESFLFGDEKNLPYMFTSKSVSNLIANDSDDNDDATYESINSVELIFISDEFLNKAIKHDLKILKNKKVDATNTIVSNVVTSKPPRKKSKSLQTTGIKNNLKIDTNRSPTVSTASDRESSISPISPVPISTSPTTTSTGTMTTTSKPGGGSSKSSATTSVSTTKNYSKKLIVISEDFKRKSLENNVVIVNASSTATTPTEIHSPNNVNSNNNVNMMSPQTQSQPLPSPPQLPPPFPSSSVSVYTESISNNVSSPSTGGGNEEKKKERNNNSSSSNNNDNNKNNFSNRHTRSSDQKSTTKKKFERDSTTTTTTAASSASTSNFN